ncbi:UMF1 family MFS transporter [Roseibium hamelinense]|uniref:UMF1 family MFS transporter n=1 Tax=Roseibium hamelinense TaxID=150831 RepID=A0A562SN51_9HYPH|nr:MFS transporter [Roseibium hamelinense]MTI44061.1 MFS transporter [Roseibium hamelinense]TWI82731.1 UMF1 family MFS transporter [Roseibium hamelinense]
MQQSKHSSAAYPPKSAAVAWALFDWAAQPFFTLITTFVFAPYFASALASTPAKGQELWGFATAAAGLAIALFAPILGSIADASGRRKPWIVACSLPFVGACWALWYAAPGNEHAVITALVCFAVAAVAIEIATVFNNAMMPTLVPPQQIGRLSSFGWAAGYVSGLVCLIIALGFMAANPESGKTLLGLSPLFGLDAGAMEGDRATGPFSAIWYLVFVLPLLFFVPDGKRKSKIGPAMKQGLLDLKDSFAQVRNHRNVLLFLIANMTYKDGLVALFAFGGIYSAGQLGWSSIEIGSFGIILTITGTFGLLISGPADDRFGPKIVLLISLFVLMVCGLGMISVDRTTVFFVFETAPAPEGALFASLPEQVFIGLGAVIGAVSGPLQSSSRSLLVRLAPKDHMTQFFGLLALSGKVTSFLAPLAVGLMTYLTNNQAAGMSVILVFFAVGTALLFAVDDTRNAGS